MEAEALAKQLDNMAWQASNAAQFDTDIPAVEDHLRQAAAHLWRAKHLLSGGVDPQADADIQALSIIRRQRANDAIFALGPKSLSRKKAWEYAKAAMDANNL